MLYIRFAGSSSTFTVSPGTITLEPKDTTATVNITLFDDDFPEDDLLGAVTTYTSSGDIRHFEVTIKDDDCKFFFDRTVDILWN